MKQIFTDDTLLAKVKCLSPEQMERVSNGMDAGNDFMFQRMRIEFKEVKAYWESSYDKGCICLMIGNGIFIIRIKFESFEKAFLKYKRSMQFIELIHN